MTRRLHIGGKIRADGWEVLDANAGPHVDHVGDAKDLSRFADATFAAIYASHVVEHLDYDKELLATLIEWRRVLEPGGKLYASVPDLDVLSALFLDRARLTAEDRFYVMRMMFGGHVDRYDYHLTGLNEEFLRSYLEAAGYAGIVKVDDLGFFEDTSRYRMKGTPISVNLTAEQPALDASAGDEAFAVPGMSAQRNVPCPCGSGRKFKHCHGRIVSP